MKADLVQYKTTKKYDYKALQVVSPKLRDYEIVHKWNIGADTRKSGMVVSVLLREAL